jgi:predicted small integral membrane protein
MAQQAPIQAPVQHKGRQGFLPFPTNTFDRCFVSVVIFVAISLLWMRFLEPLGAPLWISTIISIVLAVWIIRKG